ncbi:hypothetical protein [Streptomyces subrutilus]|uniref:hypothetical protein n=1 Tax=Streptomyces subrutilus TaxID=36818 RepID=UPI002E0D6F77|nr:hypothetical protein OG479_06655 [Streptomyces subrutilus]
MTHRSLKTAVVIALASAALVTTAGTACASSVGSVGGKYFGGGYSEGTASAGFNNNNGYVGATGGPSQAEREQVFNNLAEAEAKYPEMYDMG